MPDDEPPIAPAPGVARTPPDPWGSRLGQFMKRYGLAVSVVVGVLATGDRLYSIATHRTRSVRAMGCSTEATADTVTGIVRRKLFRDASGQALKALIDEGRFGGRLADVVTETDSPLTCSADFAPSFHLTKAFVADMARQGGDADAKVRDTEGEMDRQYRTRIRYSVARTDGGDLYVTVTGGLDVFDD